MKASDVVTQLRVLLPQLTGVLTDEVSVRSLSRSGTTITATCEDDHGLELGQAVNVSGAVVPIPIDPLTRSGTVGTLVTTSDHDLTNGIAPTVEISGANEAEFNGTFVRTNVDNRRTIKFVMADSGATLATGSPVLLGAESALRDYNSLYEVTEIPSAAKFSFTSGLADPVGTIVARTNPRIASVVDVEQAVKGYTSKQPGELWLFVALGDVFASKSRANQSDAVSFQGRGAEYRQQVIQPFTVFLFVPVSDSVAGAVGRDEAEDLFRPLCQSLLFSRFGSGLGAEALGTVQFVSHGFYHYNSAVYVHAFAFQQVVDLTDVDTVGPDIDVAFRDIDLTLAFEHGTEEIASSIDLDDEPLP